MIEDSQISKSNRRFQTSNPVSKPTEKQKSPTDLAIEKATKLIDQGKTKVEIGRAIYPDIADLSKDEIVDVFIQGIELTPKGAVTYYYNMKREAAKNPN